uniref:Uncharacterized protein n=1 Tax=Arundo donax TaxID=35708 RepID=A0A0A9C1A3_ARUDO
MLELILGPVWMLCNIFHL